MTLRRPYRPLRPDLDRFLFATVGDEIDGVPLSVISALTRLVPGARAPVSRLSNVDLPAPFGPTIPTRSPRMTWVENFRATMWSPNALETPSAAATSRPDRSACAASSRAVPVAVRYSRRLRRGACNSASRRWL